MDEDTKQMAILVPAMTIVVLTVILSLRGCVNEVSRLNADLQAKCIAAHGVWDDRNAGGLGRCIIAAKEGA